MLQNVYDELSDHGYNSLPKRYQKSDTLQVQLCWVGARRPYRTPDYFGDKFSDKFGDKFVTEFGDH